MTRTLLLATAAAALLAAPVQAQMRTDTDAGKSWNVPHSSSASGLPTDSPQVESLYNRTGNTGPYSGGSTTTTTTSSGSTGYTSSGAASGSVMSRDDITARRGRGQNDLELTQTSLLNEFSAQGYTAVRDFRKNGQNYTANVQDQQGRWMTVEIDPRTRAISPVR